MAPVGLAVLIGAGKVTGAGIARILASPSHGNLAVALISRTGDSKLADEISKSSGGGVLKAFKSDTSEQSLSSAFDDIKAWAKTIDDDLKLKLAVFSIKHSHKVPFEEETAQKYTESMTTYATGAVIFSQLSIKWMLNQHPEPPKLPSGAAPTMHKAGTLVFTGTLGFVSLWLDGLTDRVSRSLRTNPGYAAYGGGRAAVRMLAQSLAREFSARGVHVVHAIANGGITDKYHKYHADESGNIETEGECSCGTEF